jgi:NADPH-dependent F420 reductase
MVDAVCEALVMEIGVLGGTGPQGKGIATRLAALGHTVVVGSRTPERSAAVVSRLRERWGDRVAGLRAGDNAEAAAADVVVVATVWDAAVPTAGAHAEQLAGKPVVVIANGLKKEGRAFRPMTPPEGSIAEAVQAVAPAARVAAAFHLVPAAALADLDHPIDADVPVVSDDDAARSLVLDLVDGIAGLRGLDAGPLWNARGIESFAAVLLTLNLRHKGEGSLRVVGLGPRRATEPVAEPVNSGEPA